MRTALALLALLYVLPAAAEMRGHGGPVKAIAIAPDGKTAVTGSFDTSVILWDLERETAKQVLRIHDGPVNSVGFENGDVVSSSDGKTVLWTPGRDQPKSVSTPAMLADGAIAALPEIAGGVMAFPDGRMTIRNPARSFKLPSAANTLATAPDGEIIAGGADGKVYILQSDGTLRLNIEVQDMPITSLAVSVDGRMIAAAGLRGAVRIIARDTGRDISTLIGPGLPVWSLAFHPDGKTILTGGADRMVRKWDVASGQPLAPANAPRPDFPQAAMNERGAQLFRACDACHTVTPDGGNRAGPTLHGVFGRRIGMAKDYAYSSDFAKLDIIWNAESITRLFRDGPAKITPGTKMPEQTFSNAEELKVLVDWLEKVTK